MVHDGPVRSDRRKRFGGQPGDSLRSVSPTAMCPVRDEPTRAYDRSGDVATGKTRMASCVAAVRFGLAAGHGGRGVSTPASAGVRRGPGADGRAKVAVARCAALAAVFPVSAADRDAETPEPAGCLPVPGGSPAKVPTARHSSAPERVRRKERSFRMSAGRTGRRQRRRQGVCRSIRMRLACFCGHRAIWLGEASVVPLAVRMRSSGPTNSGARRRRLSYIRPQEIPQQEMRSIRSNAKFLLAERR